jgi:hypothetical protein
MTKISRIAQAIDQQNSTSTAAQAVTTAVLEEGIALTPVEWSTLLQVQLDDSSLLAKHRQLLESESDQIQIKALELAYKIKGKLQEVPTQAVTIHLDF